MSPKIAELAKALSELMEESRRRFKVELKGIFGSVVRSEEKPGSDIDILVEFREDANLFDLAGLSLFLEERLHRPVDIVPQSSLRPEIKASILKETVFL